MGAGADVRNFYGSITDLSSVWARHPIEPWARDLIETSFVCWKENGLSGIPLGLEVSPMLANLVLLAVDWALEAAGVQYVRYMDDYLLFEKEFSRVAAAVNLMQSEVLPAISLSIAPEKTRFFIGLDECLAGIRDESVSSFHDEQADVDSPSAVLRELVEESEMGGASQRTFRFVLNALARAGDFTAARFLCRHDRLLLLDPREAGGYLGTAAKGCPQQADAAFAFIARASEPAIVLHILRGLAGGRWGDSERAVLWDLATDREFLRHVRAWAWVCLAEDPPHPSSLMEMIEDEPDWVVARAMIKSLRGPHVRRFSAHCEAVRPDLVPTLRWAEAA